MKTRNGRSRTIAAYSGIALVLLVMLLRAFYSFCQSDESFYAALVQRLWLGDRLIIDEWHPCQFYAPLLLPFYGLFRLFSPTASGVLVYFRLVYLLLAAMTAVYVFRYFRSAGKTDGLALPLTSAFLVLLFSRANIQGMSYYNLCFLLVLTAAISCCKKKRITMQAASALAGAALCLPYLAPVLILGMLIGMIVWPSARRDIMRAGLVMVGLAVLYIVFFVREPGNGFTGFSHVLSDPQHQDTLEAMLSRVRRKLPVYMPYLVPATLITTVAICLPLKERIAGIILRLYYLLAAVLLVYDACQCEAAITNIITLPLSIAGLPALAYRLRTRQSCTGELVFYLTGTAIALLFMVSSNTGLDAMTTGMTISGIAAVNAIGHALLDGHADRAWGKLVSWTLLGTILAAVICCFVLQHIPGVYRDATITRLTARITDGPAAGLLTTPEHKTTYDSIYETIAQVHEEYPAAAVLHSKKLPWAYLAADWTYGTPSAWENSDARLNEYYAEHPKRMPELVFVYDASVGGFEKALFNHHIANETPNANACPGFVTPETYTAVKETSFLTVYHRND